MRALRLAPGVLLLCLGGCLSTSENQNSSVVDYLYPQSRNVEVSTGIPTLVLPLKVGVAFVPSFRASPALTETKKAELLREVSANFEGLDFVKSIEIIPSAYLRPGGSFENLEQIQRMFDVDVIALVSYDQSRFTDEGIASLAYWTVVGAYLVRGEKNSTHTMLDAVVYDIASRRLLFRAPGTSSVKSSATLVNAGEQIREDAVKGFEIASDQLVDNLKVELDAFRTKVKEVPATAQIVQRDGQRGSGSGGWLLVLAAAAALAAVRRS